MNDNTLLMHECDAMPDDYVIYVDSETKLATLESRYIYGWDNDLEPSICIDVTFCPWCGEKVETEEVDGV